MGVKRGDVIFYKVPEAKVKGMVIGFSGWADAGYISSYCLKYLISKLKAEKVAEIISDDFFILSNINKRPRVVVRDAYIEEFEYPSFEFYIWNSEEGGFVFSFGPEPDMKWKEFLKALYMVVEELKVKRVYSIGGLVSSERKTSAVVNKRELKEELERYDIECITYKGPSSIHSAMLSYFRDKGIEAISLWGNTPFSHSEDPGSWYEVVKKVIEILEIEVDIEDLRRLAEEFKRRMEEKEREERGRRREERSYELPYFM
ncbi:MAG: proteasome assembly chaperone family protein [Candidatus Methanospirareceae archaeon]